MKDPLAALLDVTDLLDATVAAARARSPEVGALPEAEVRRHVHAMIGAAATALARGGDVTEADLAAAGRLGADRARQGVPVEALLDGFQAGRAELVAAVVARGRAAGLPADDLLEAVTRFDPIATALEHRMVHAHRVTELEQTRTARESAAQDLRRVLHGEPPRRPLDPAVRHHCVVTAVSDPAAATTLEPALSARGLCGFVDGRLTAVVSGPGARSALAGWDGTAVVAPGVGPGGLPEMYGLCRRALQAAGDRPGVWSLTELALDTAVAAEPGLGGLLVEELLGGLDRADPFDRELVATALAFLDNGGRIEGTAAALHVHPNTVKYRIRRLRERAGPLPVHGPVAETVRWWWALRTWAE